MRKRICASPQSIRKIHKMFEKNKNKKLLSKQECMRDVCIYFWFLYLATACELFYTKKKTHIDLVAYIFVCVKRSRQFLCNAFRAQCSNQEYTRAQHHLIRTYFANFFFGIFNCPAHGTVFFCCSILLLLLAWLLFLLARALHAKQTHRYAEFATWVVQRFDRHPSAYYMLRTMDYKAGKWIWKVGKKCMYLILIKLFSFELFNLIC